MKKLVLIGLLMMALLVTVIACSGQNDPIETDPDTTVQETPTQDPIEDSTEEPTDAVEETTVGSAEVTDPEETTAEPDDGYPENRLVVDKETYLEGEQIFITAYGGGKDWVGVARVGETEVIRWWYLEKVDGFKNVRSGIKFDITAAEANGDSGTALTVGDYIIYLVADDKKLADNDFIQIAAISIVEGPTNIETEPETEEVDIESFKGITGYQDRTGIPCFEFYDSAINLGNYDFSKYTKAIIGYGYDGSHWSVAQGFENAPTLAIGFKSTNTSFGITRTKGGETDGTIDEENSTVNMDGAIAYAQMEFVEGTMFREGGHEAVIDLTEVDYKGDVYLTLHTPQAWIEVYYVIFVVDPNYNGSGDNTNPTPPPEYVNIPAWTSSGFVTHFAFDYLQQLTGDKYVADAFTPGQGHNWVDGSWNGSLNTLDEKTDTLRVKGWFAATGGQGQLGYQLNDGEVVFNDAFLIPNDGYANAAPAGSDHWAVVDIRIDLTGLTGTNTVVALYKNAKGSVAYLAKITFTIPEDTGDSEPVEPDPTPDPEPEDPVEPDYVNAPVWLDSGVVTHFAFDYLQQLTGDKYVADAFAPGQGGGWVDASWTGSMNTLDAKTDTIRVKGWFAATGGQGQFGYMFNDGEAVFNDAFLIPNDDYAQHAPAGSDHWAALDIRIALTGLTGTNTVTVLYKNANGSVAYLTKITFTIPEDTGDSDDVITEEVDIGSFKGKPGYQGSNEIPTFEIYDWAIDLGEYDLSKYTQVIIGYGYDAVAESVANGFATAPSLPIGFKSTNTSFGKNGGELNMTDTIVSGQMQYVGGAENDRRAGKNEVTIDLTDIDYKGNLYLSAYTPDAWIEVYYIIFVVDAN